MTVTSDDLGKKRASNLDNGSVYRFREFLLNVRNRTLSRADSPVCLTPKAFDVLCFLVQNPNRLVTKEELLQAIWGETIVEEGNLTQYISHIRKALGDNSEESRLIVTIARKGYQFTANVIVGEAVDAKEAEVPVSSTESSVTDALPIHEVPPVKKSPGRWLKGAAVGAFAAAILVVVCFVFRQPLGVMKLPGSPKTMIAVLPFENLTGDPNEEYLADGLTEEMISQLSRANPEQLGVIARTSVMAYKRKDARLDQIGRDLSVQYVLENSLRESENHLRLTAQLIQVKDQSHVWSKDYDYPAEDLLTVEDDVAKAVVQEIRVRLTSQQQPKLGQSHPANQEAFDAYLQGYYFFQRNTDKDTEMAVKYYERATQLDPSYALAWAGLSRVRKWQASSGLIPAEEGYRLAREAVERALALNPNLAQAYLEMGRIKQQVDFDLAGADASIQRAISLEPGNPEGVRMAGFSAALLGRLDEALQLERRAVDLDPLNGGSWEELGETEFFMGRLREAVGDLKKALELNPGIWNGHIFLSEAYVIQGRPQDALPEIEQVRYEYTRGFLYAMAYHALGRENDSDIALNELIAKFPNHPYNIAKVYAFRNKSRQAFEWLDRCYAQRDDGLIETKIDPLLKSLHHDPRYAALLKKLNFST
jgi:TolB-like protein/DNA-binding winged helix-turn-helix (wHTH) protein/Flp pilus assembly protein TadD